MKSKTSFFNATALKKNITRYAPIWAVYTIFWLLFLFNLAPRHAANAADNVLDMLGEMVWLNLIYGGLCAAFLFMDLFKSRLCNALHALPISRDPYPVGSSVQPGAEPADYAAVLCVYVGIRLYTADLVCGIHPAIFVLLRHSSPQRHVRGKSAGYGCHLWYFALWRRVNLYGG